MIFQDPFGALNPRRRVGSIIGDPLAIHTKGSGAERKRQVQELMELVGLNPEHYNRFPAEFSGGQRQRIGVARALALRPKLIICDEPVSALDVSIQAQILNLLVDLQEEFKLTYVFIAHDLSVVRNVSNRIAVMYLGKVLEQAAADDFYRAPRHPYSAALLSAATVPGSRFCGPSGADRARRRPALADPPSGGLPVQLRAARGYVPTARRRCRRLNRALTTRHRTRLPASTPSPTGRFSPRTEPARIESPAPVKLGSVNMPVPGAPDPWEVETEQADVIQGRSPWRLGFAKLRRDRAAMIALGVVVRSPSSRCWRR